MLGRLEFSRLVFTKLFRNLILLIFLLPFLSACGVGGLFSNNSNINTKTKFSPTEYGVKASQRVTTSAKIRKGGGRYQIGKPYKIAGKWYRPKEDPNYDRTGVASWYGPNFHGRRTANGEIFDQYGISAAHPTLPLPSYVRVTNLENNRSIIVRVNDRGPFANGRIIDLSKRVAQLLGMAAKGTARVRVKYVGAAPLEGDDTKILLASLNRPSKLEQRRGRGIFSLASLSGNKNAPIPANRTKRNVSSYFPNNFPFSVNSSSGVGPLFYSASNLSGEEKNNLINNAFAAVNSMAARSDNLAAWRNITDQDALKIHMELGVFLNKDNAEKVATQFALLGAVDEQIVTLRGNTAIKLTLTQLKAGVSRKDVIDLAYKLGLKISLG